MSKLKYKVGDRVRIKSLDWYNENKDKVGNIRYKRDGSAYPVFFSKYMSNFCGEILTIKSVFNHSYHMNETSSCEFWTDEMIKGLVEEETKPLTYEETVEIIETMQGIGDSWECPQGYQFVDENGNVINATKIVLEKKTGYPKTYEECRDIIAEHLEMDCNPNSELILSQIPIHEFCKLIVARNAYWKLYGEEMGLGKPWEPDWNTSEPKYVIACTSYGIEKQWENTYCKVFAFPTEEMRDAFYENFKSEIEICKELL